MRKTFRKRLPYPRFVHTRYHLIHNHNNFSALRFDTKQVFVASENLSLSRIVQHFQIQSNPNLISKPRETQTQKSQWKV